MWDDDKNAFTASCLLASTTGCDQLSVDQILHGARDSAGVLFVFYDDSINLLHVRLLEVFEVL
jgi:hypothetical protein